MFAIRRLSNLRLVSQIVYTRKPEFLTLVRYVTLKPSKYIPPPAETHDERNMRIGRPQSPHLTIYAPELQSLLSMTHRMTGAALSGYTILFALTTLVLPDHFSHYVDMIQALNLGTVLITMARFALALPLCYHLCNGVRHLIWDLGIFLSMKAVLATGYLMLATAFTASTLLALM